MATIVTIDADDSISSSRSDINTNFANLNSDKIETSVIDTDTTLSANSDDKIPSQKAVKAYIDAGGASDFPSSFVTTSAGATDSGKGIKLNSSGFIDETAIPFDYLKTRTFKSGVTTKSLSDANGTQNIAHGLGSAPQRVRIYGSVKFSDTSTGVITFIYDSSSSQYNTMTYDASGTDSSENGTGIRLYGNSNLSTYQNGVVTVDATNISIAWTKTGSPTATWNLLWEAEAFTI